MIFYLIFKMQQSIEQKLAKYFELTSKALKKVKISKSLDPQVEKSAEDILDLSQRYYNDARYFEKKNDLLNAYGAVVYAHAFLDIGAKLGFFDVGNDNEFFMVD